MELLGAAYKARKARMAGADGDARGTSDSGVSGGVSSLKTICDGDDVLDEVSRGLDKLKLES